MVIITPLSTIRDAATKIKQYTEQNEDLFSQILNMVNSVEACGDWQGKSMKSLQTVTQKNQKKFETGMRELYELAEFLQKYADAMDTRDKDLKAQIQSI